MKCAASSARCSALTSMFPLLAVMVAMALMTSCGSGGSMSKTPPPPQFSGNTQVTVMLTSTANDEVSQFDVELQSLTLTSQSGKTVPLLSSQQSAEFMHLNGEIEPLATVTVPQDVYTSATATLAGSVFVCLGQVPGEGVGISNYSIVNGGPTVDLPNPITVTGDSMGLLVNMQVSSSAVFPACWTNPPFDGFSMTPTFTLAPIVLFLAPRRTLETARSTDLWRRLRRWERPGRA